MDIDTEMFPLVQTLWVMGLVTLACCQDIGESAAGLRDPERTTPSGHGGFVEYYREYAWLKMPLNDGKVLLNTLLETPFHDRVTIRWQPGSWRMHVRLEYGEKNGIDLAYAAQIYLPGVQIAELTTILTSRVRERMAAVSTEHAYRVIVTREGDAWLADVPELEGAHTFARTLPALDRAVREVVVMAADRPDEDMLALHLAYDYRTGDPDIDVTATEIRTLREHADQLSATATARTGAAAAQLVDRGFSVRDVATILGISPQRVSQLTGTTKASWHRVGRQRDGGVDREPPDRGAVGVKLAGREAAELDGPPDELVTFLDLLGSPTGAHVYLGPTTVIDEVADCRSVQPAVGPLVHVLR